SDNSIWVASTVDICATRYRTRRSRWIWCQSNLRKARPKIVDASSTPKANRLLAALPETVYRRLLPDLEVTNLSIGETLCSPAGRLQFAYFPTSSVLACYFAVKKNGAM